MEPRSLSVRGEEGAIAAACMTLPPLGGVITILSGAKNQSGGIANWKERTAGVVYDPRLCRIREARCIYRERSSISFVRKHGEWLQT